MDHYGQDLLEDERNFLSQLKLLEKALVPGEEYLSSDYSAVSSWRFSGKGEVPETCDTDDLGEMLVEFREEINPDEGFEHPPDIDVEVIDFQTYMTDAGEMGGRIVYGRPVPGLEGEMDDFEYMTLSLSAPVENPAENP